MTNDQRRPDPADVVDVFVYVVVLNLAVQFVPEVVTETFTLSLLTALLLKVVLELVLLVKSRLRGRVRSAATIAGKVAAGVVLWLALVSSKVAVLELVAVMFGDRVSLGGFWAVTGLIVVLMLSRLGVRTLLDPARRSPV